MAVRLQLKIGVVPAADRLSDSPDTIVTHEPSTGSMARSKGHLYLLVSCRIPGHRAREATRLVAATIKEEYYYDESAGIRVCLAKAIATANKRLAHQRDRFGLGHAPDGNGPVGVGVAVVRGNELYVATVGPAEAYLIRQARLSTLPDPHRERGLPAGELEVDVWRGEIAVGDSLVLVSPNVMARLGPDELKDAMLTLHPQSAMEHLHHRFVASDGAGSDGAIAFEATEVAATHRQRTLVPVRPAEPLAGAPDRSPIPLADPVVGGVAAVQAGADRVREAAGSALDRVIFAVQDVLPRRPTAYRRVTPLAARRESQRRAALALLAFVVVATGLGVSVYVLGGQAPREAISSVTVGERALREAREAIAAVFGPGIDLVEDDPPRALEQLAIAHDRLDEAAAAGVGAATITPLREQVVEGLDRLYGVVPVAWSPLYQFPPLDPTTNTAPDVGALIEGPDGAPYVLDRGTASVWRLDLATGGAALIYRSGTTVGASVQGAPRFLARGGLDLLVLDDQNLLWRWRPSDASGAGTTTLVGVQGQASWGDDIRDIGTYLRDSEAGLYNLYVVDPSERQILAYAPAADGSGFPARPTGRLSAARAVETMTSLYIDGDIFVIENGVIERFVSGNSGGWAVDEAPDVLLRPAPTYTRITSGTGRREGLLYAYDPPNGRILAFEKASGAYIEQYRPAGGVAPWEDLRGMFVRPGIDGDPSVLVWADATAVYESLLVPVPDVPPPSPSPSPSVDPSASVDPAASAAAP
ncbi:MAG TPA: hypothetical protein VFR14_04115 [Candidatus Limnocylindrales bacterium]|nr:hypothetical protein [Candidatus Limnocylindrales bacterium]